MPPMVAVFFLTALVSVATALPAAAQSVMPLAPSTIPALRAREAECESKLQAAYRERADSVMKAYLSPEARSAERQQLEVSLEAQHVCLLQTGEALFQALTIEERECRGVADRSRPGGEDDARDATRCVAEARQERIVREQMRGFQAQQHSCEQQAVKLDELLHTLPAPAAAAPAGATPGRPSRDVESERRAMQQARDRSVTCAQQASVQIGHFEATLGTSSSNQQAISDQAFARDTAALLDLVRRAGEGASTWTHEAFARAVEVLRGRLVTYRYVHQTMIARDPDASRRLLAAAEALFAVAEAWQAEIGAGRDAARFKADVETGLQRQASASERLNVGPSRRGYSAAIEAQAAASRARADAMSRLQSFLAGLQTSDVRGAGAR